MPTGLMDKAYQGDSVDTALFLMVAVSVHRTIEKPNRSRPSPRVDVCL